MESFFSSHGPSSDAGATRVKAMRWPASVRLGHTTVLSAKAIQISNSGVGLLMERTLREGETALVRVDAFVSGNPVRLQARTSVVCCTCVGMDGFRISLRFQELDDDAQSAVEALLGAAR
ncbi:PilZ domain-containing protein [Steroidobacter flavus]|uniref:PilZ domain-containing protein n=1 Tax=Steroidobacter flavus TaxID=1842136 RepID=A0ABV8SWA6_9GAMM